MDVNLLDESGRETNNRQGYDWKALPGSVGRAVTGPDGRFQIPGIADRACCLIRVNRPETDNASLSLYGATIEGPDMVHEQLPPAAFNGRMRHQVRTNPITITFPTIRPIDVTVVGEDTGRPIAGARVSTVRESLATGIGSYGTTDATGKVRLGLPPGQYKGIMSDPPIKTRYLRTYQRPLVVEPGRGGPALRAASEGRVRADHPGGRCPAGHPDGRRLLLEGPRGPARSDPGYPDVHVLVRRELDRREGGATGRHGPRAGSSLPLPFRRHPRA